MQTDFHYHPRTELVFGNHALDRAPEWVQIHGGQRVLLVTDTGLMLAGHPQRLQLGLEKAGLSVFLFDHTIENPTTDIVNECTDFAKRHQIDFIIGLGGGSSLDTAKGCNFIYTNGGEMKDYWGVGKAAKPMLPLMAIPTTAGTGSECQSFALISDAKTHVKMACGDPKAAPKVSILDPQLTLSQPDYVAACTGIDALVHALETAVTTKRNPISTLFSREAFRLGHKALARIFEDGMDEAARADMLLAAAFAGTAIENSMLGAAHAAANPLTANYHIIHGQAVGVMIPHVIRYNAQVPEIAALYQQAALECGLASSAQSTEESVEALVSFWRGLMRAANLKTTLLELNIPEADFPKLADQAAQQWTARFNPREVTEQNFLSLYQSAF